MKNKFIYLALFSSALISFNSCRKDEIAIKKIDRIIAVPGDTDVINSGVVITSTVDMGADYKQQLFYSLSKNIVASSNLKTDWDLQFESSANGYLVKLNSSKAMGAYNTGQTNFNSVTDTIGSKANEKVDSPTGRDDSTAIGNWQTNMPVYIINRGYNEAGTHQGFIKIQIQSVDQNQFVIKVANLNGSNEVTATIAKDGTKSFTYFSLSTNIIVSIDPGKINFDLVFSQYTHIYQNPYSTYLVTGVLINPYKVSIAPVSDKAFTDIVLTDTIAHPFNTYQNTIGYNWKAYDFTTSAYTVDPSKNYLIKDVRGYYYKLHFIDFYNALGQKGCPKFEFQRL